MAWPNQPRRSQRPKGLIDVLIYMGVVTLVIFFSVLILGYFFSATDTQANSLATAPKAVYTFLVSITSLDLGSIFPTVVIVMAIFTVAAAFFKLRNRSAESTW